MSSTDNKTSALMELALVGGGLVASSALTYAAVKTWSKLKPICSALYNISQAKIVPISDLRSLISSASCESESESSKEMLVIVRGITKAHSRNYQTNNALVSEVSKEKCVVLEQTWNCSSIEGMVNKTLLKKIPFSLSETGSPNHVFVNLEGSHHSLPLTQVFDFHCNRDIRPPFRSIFSLDFLTEEKILPIGKELTAVGICSLQDGNPQIKACEELPYFLSNLTRDEMVEWLTDIRSILIMGFLFFAIHSLNVLGRTFWRSWRMWKAWKQQRIDRNIQDAAADGTRQDTPVVPNVLH